MINGPETTSPDKKSNDPDSPLARSLSVSPSPPPSRYSSCGESEFERYCSANSMLGTPSLCGESEYGSLKSFDDFSLGGKGFSRILDNRKLSDYMNSVKRDGSLQFFGESSGGGNILDDNAGNDEDCLENDRSIGNNSEEDRGEILSGCDNSDDYDDADSMYSCGSDEESRNNLYYKGEGSCAADLKVRKKNENPLAINSSVAFGSDDWDDFERENGEFGEQDHEGDLFARVASKGVLEDASEIPASIMGVEDRGLLDDIRTCSLVPSSVDGFGTNLVGEVRDIPMASCSVEGDCKVDAYDTSNVLLNIPSLGELQEDVKNVISNNTLSGDTSVDFVDICPGGDIVEMKRDFLERAPLELELDSTDHGKAECPSSLQSCAVIVSGNDTEVGNNQEMLDSGVEENPICTQTSQHLFFMTEYSENENAHLFEEQKPVVAQSSAQNDPLHSSNGTPPPVDLSENHTALVKADNVGHNELYDEIVNEMEEILLDSNESLGAKFPQVHFLRSQISLPLRDGGSTASTSGLDNAYPLITQPRRIDKVEVVGAKQKHGDVSITERLVGVKAYTVYMIRVWSGEDQWTVERRYRDFSTLYRRLKSLFANQGLTLPFPWPYVEKESRKIFGNASPDVVAERSILIQECLHSIIHSGNVSSIPSPLLWFLYPQDNPSSPASDTPPYQSVFSDRGRNVGDATRLGKTISLILEIHPSKPTKQMLDAQYYTCAGCRSHFDEGLTIMQDFVMTLGWGKPRLCEYTGQLFCSSCHTNDMAVLPAKVLHHWDFTKCPVSQLAKFYLDSIYDQPMLCVSAVNPLLFSKVPALQHVMNVRKKIAAMLPFLRCPFRRTINNGLGSRRYILESNDFFALRDLIDLSKGPFAGLPVMLETVCSKILEHITEQCLVCCDVGIPCNARHACEDPSSLIFPFQEGQIERCKSCRSVFHKSCFKKLENCSCGAHIGLHKSSESTNLLSRQASDLISKSRTILSRDLLSGLLSKAKPGWINDIKGDDTVIFMGALPGNTTL